MLILRAARSLLVIAAVMLAAAPRVRAVDVPNPFPPGSFITHTLPNGLRLLVHEDHSLPIVALVVVLRTGSALNSDPRGVAHYHEHLIFQGTEHYPGRLAPQYALEQVGGISNATTSRDMTRISATAGSGQVALLMNVLADVLLAPTLDDDSFARERSIILAEIQQDGDNPLTMLLNLGYASSYQAYPYRYRPTGSIEDVLRLNPADVRAFNQRWAKPNNLSVVLVGDVTLPRAIALAQQAFGAAQSGLLPAPPAAEPPSPEAIMREHVARPMADTFQLLVYPACPTGDFTTMVATDLLYTLLSSGGDALLPRQWATDAVTPTDFGVEYVSTRAPGRFMIWAQTPPAQAYKLRQSTMTLMTRLATEAVPDELFTAAKQRLATQFLLENETYSQQAATIAFYEGLGKSPQLSRYLPIVQSLTLQQLRAALPKRPLAWVTLGQRPEGER